MPTDTVGSADTQTRRMAAFVALTRNEQRRAIQNLSAAGMSDGSISRATGLSVEQVCRVLSEATTVATASGSTP